MKYLMTFVLVCMFTVGAFSGDMHDHKMDKSAKADSMQCKLKEGESCTAVQVSTAQCEMCVNTIETAVKSAEGVTMAKVDLEKKVAHVHFTDKASVEKIEKAIAAAGYDANDMKRDESAHAKLPACCQLKR